MANGKQHTKNTIFWKEPQPRPKIVGCEIFVHVRCGEKKIGLKNMLLHFVGYDE